MRPALLLLLLATAALAAEGLPKGFEPGLRAEFTQTGTGETLRGTVVLTVEEGATPETVRVVREYRTDTEGPLAMRDRLVAVVGRKSRRVLSFTYEIGKAEGDLVLAARCGPDAEREGKLLHERFTYAEKDEPTVTKFRPRPAGAWVPDRLEPFVVGLLAVTSEEPAELYVMNTLKGRVAKSPARYRLLGEGAKKVGGKDVSCRILLRTRAKEKGKSYLSAEDALPLTDTTHRIERKAPRPGGKEKDR